MTEQAIEFTFDIASRKRRIAAFLIDHAIIVVSMTSIIFIALGANSEDESNPGKVMKILQLVMIPGFALYFAKDCLNGISIGKWAMGIMVRDESNGNEIPSIGRLLLRNLFIIIWPIEFIVLAASDEKKRLGDKIAKTCVVRNPNRPAKTPRVLVLAAVGLLFCALVFFLVVSSMKNSEAYKIAIIEIEKNEQIKEETGGITGYGMMPTGSISTSNDQGQAQLEIKVLGKRKDVTVSVYLRKEPSGQWKLIEMK